MIDIKPNRELVLDSNFQLPSEPQSDKIYISDTSLESKRKT